MVTLWMSLCSSTHVCQRRDIIRLQIEHALWLPTLPLLVKEVKKEITDQVQAQSNESSESEQPTLPPVGASENTLPPLPFIPKTEKINLEKPLVTSVL